LPELRERIPRLEAWGLTGVMVGDHLFIQVPGQPRSEARRPLEPMTMLATVATLSDRLHIGTMVSNLGFLHPVLVLRQFAQLAALFGGERVLAGLGAGWNRDEFEAIGVEMPGFRARLDRLEEAVHLARELFDNGIASIEGSQVVARELPLAPRPAVPPRILVGGGSDRLLDIAGRYADVLDLNGSSRRSKVAGPDLPGADARRRLTTTVRDLEASVDRVRSASEAAGRPRDAVSMSVLVGWLEFCRASDVTSVAERICRDNGLPPQSLGDCPYVLLGEPDQMVETLKERHERFGLDMVIIAGSIDPQRFCHEVLPHVG
jgi:alkanesulfonate monooxygenase SsuD/methylene tetrahydromethanopterin reductase-like flavin-dependent oxidoreductase (luciferase family)